MHNSYTDDTVGGGSRRGDSGKSKVGEEASRLASDAKEKVREQVHRQRDTVSESVTDFADAIRRAAEELNLRDQSVASKLLLNAAAGLEGFSRTVSSTEPEDVLRSVKDFSQRQPYAFLTGAALLGFAASRFLRSSERSRGRAKTRPESSDPLKPQMDPASVSPMPTSPASPGYTAAPSSMTTDTPTSPLRED